MKKIGITLEGEVYAWMVVDGGGAWGEVGGADPLQLLLLHPGNSALATAHLHHKTAEYKEGQS